MEVHIGKEIEKKYNESGLKLSEFAKKINTGTRNIYSIFKRSDINSALLKKIGEALRYDFFQFYQKEYKKGTAPTPNIHESPASMYGSPRSVTVSIALDGTQQTLDYWVATIKKMNSALS